MRGFRRTGVRIRQEGLPAACARAYSQLMSALELFDPTLYTRAPILTIATAITLGRALVEGCPQGAPLEVKKAAKKLKNVTDAAQDAWAARQREQGEGSEEDSRLIDQVADNVWSAARSRLQAYALLPVKDFPKAARAGELVVKLFGGDGLSFLKEAYPVQLSSMSTLLQRIDEEGLAEEINELAGPEFLQAIRKVLPRYKAMVNAMLKRDEASGQNLLEHVRAVQRAVVVYATKVCATVDDDDEGSIKAAEEALRPIVKLREAASARRGNAEATVPSLPGESAQV